jgi:hypothetical protein
MEPAGNTASNSIGCLVAAGWTRKCRIIVQVAGAPAERHRFLHVAPQLRRHMQQIATGNLKHVRRERARVMAAQAVPVAPQHN